MSKKLKKLEAKLDSIIFDMNKEIEGYKNQIENLNNQVRLLEMNNYKLKEERDEFEVKYKDIQSEFTKFKMQVQLFRCEQEELAQVKLGDENPDYSIIGEVVKPAPKKNRKKV